MSNGESSGGSGGSGCLKAAGIGCAVLLVLCIVAGVVVVKMGGTWFKAGAAKVLEIGAESVMLDLGLPQAEVDKAMAPVRDLASRIKAGEIIMAQAEALATAFTEGPVVTGFYCVAFQYNQ